MKDSVKASPVPDGALEQAGLNRAAPTAATSVADASPESPGGEAPSVADGIEPDCRRQPRAKLLGPGPDDVGRAGDGPLPDGRPSRAGWDPDAVRWPGDLGARQRADRKEFAQRMLDDPYADGGPVERVVREATHLERAAAMPPGDDASEQERREWDEGRRAYAASIVPPDIGIAQIVDVTRRFIEEAYPYADGEPHDGRGLFPGDREIRSFLSACLFGSTEESYVTVDASGSHKVKTRRIDCGCMPLYKRDYSKSVRAQVPIELMMLLYAACELWRAEADGEPYVFLIDGKEGQGFLTQRDHGPDGPYRRVSGPESRDNAGEDVMAMVSRYADGVSQRSAVDFYLDLCRLAPYRSVKDVDPALVPLGSGYMFDPRTKRGRPMTDDDAIVGCMAGLTWEFREDGTVVPVPKPVYCKDGAVVDSEEEAAEHGGVADFDPERFLAEIQPTEDGRNAIWDVTQAAATPRMPRAKGVIFEGASRAGKGLTLGILLNGFGNEAQRARTTTTMNMTQFAVRELNVAARGKLLVYSHEESTGGYIKDCAPFKAYVEHKPFATRDLFEHKTEVTGVGLFVQCMNEHIGVSDKSPAMLGRLFVIPFKVSHLGSEDRRLERWLGDPRTANWWYYHALVELPFQPELRENALTRAAKGEYQLSIDPVRQFFDEEVSPKVGEFTPIPLLYDMYLRWSKHANPSGRPLSRRSFTSALEALAGERPAEFVCPREQPGKDGSQPGFVRLTASRVFDPKQAKGYLRDPTMYCTPRTGYMGSVTWEPRSLDAWCNGEEVSKKGQVRGWLVRANAWETYRECGMTPAEKAAEEERARAQAERAAEEERARAQAERAAEERARAQAEDEADATPEPGPAERTNLADLDTDERYARFRDSVELACEEFGGYRLREGDDLRTDPLSRDEWAGRGCPVELLNDARIARVDYVPWDPGSQREAVDTDVAYGHYAANARRWLDRHGAYAIGSPAAPLGDVTVLERVLDRAAWRALGMVVEPVSRVRAEDGSMVWLFLPAWSGSWNEPTLDTSEGAYARYRALAQKSLDEASGYAVKPDDGEEPFVLREAVSRSLWSSLGSPSVSAGDVDVDGVACPLLEPATTPGDLEYMRHRRGDGDDGGDVRS